MPTQDILPIARSIVDHFNRHDINALLPLISDNLDSLDVPMNFRFKGKDGYKQYVQNWWNAFPDGKMEVKNIFAAGDFVVIEFIGRGTHQGTFSAFGRKIPATNKRVEMAFCEVSQIKDGKLVGSHLYFDLVTMLRQLGMESQLGQLAAA